MAPSLSSAKILLHGLSSAISRRGFSAAASASQGAARGGAAAASRSAATKKQPEAAEKVAWVPDPVTGCYRPDSGVKEIDAAELRDMLLKKH